MTATILISPFVDELPSQFADRLGQYYAQRVSADHKKNKGQFFTPAPIAQLMGSMCAYEGTTLRILDPGCGVCVLACSAIEYLIEQNAALRSIDLTAYETDTDLIVYARQSLQHLQTWLSRRQVELRFDLHTQDFVLDNADALSEYDQLFTKRIEPFDIIISNPPYFKIPKTDIRTLAAKALVSGQPNIYSFFMGIAAKLLKPDGQLIFITPRSFTSGSYFKSFRTFFFQEVRLDRIHLFVSRKDTFNRDNVLQETVIIKALKQKKADSRVTITSSHGLKDLDRPSVKYFKQEDLIDLRSKEKILHFPTSNNEEAILDLFKSWTGTLRQYNIQISTGPVVAFRAKDFIKETPDNGTVSLAPLFWLHNVGKMVVKWPELKPGKGQYILIADQSKSLLIPNKNYVFLRRFSAKDDKSRLIAAPHFQHFSEADCIGVENKLNYIYRKNGHLDLNEVIGICTLLNSRLFDSYFRIFNGNVNVSATELREMPLPPLETIKAIGDQVITADNYSPDLGNEIVAQYFELADIL
jgi:adenine-specific DNA-methyltransferase